MILNIDTLLRVLKRTVISCVIVIVCLITNSAWVQAQSSASSIFPVLSLLLLDNSINKLTDVVNVTTGGSYSCARLADGSVKCWGLNGNGQLGDGTTTDRHTPVAAQGISTATAITAGNSHSCARLADGSVTCWGHNSFGQLGDGTTIRKLTPVLVW